MGRRKKTMKKTGSDIEAAASQQSSLGSQLNRENPFLNSLLLENILELMNPTFKDLQIFRQVCRVWSEVSLNKWRECAVLSIIPDRQRPQQQGIPLSHFLQLYHNPECPHNFSTKPFSKYKLKGFEINQQFGSGDHQQYRDFRESIGQQIEYLHFEKCKFFGVGRDIQTLYDLLLRIFPNVKELSLSQIEYKNPSGVLTQLVSKSQITDLKLETLTIFGDVHYEVYCDLLVTALNLQTIRGIDLPFDSTACKGKLDMAVSHALPAICYTQCVKFVGDADLNNENAGVPIDATAYPKSDFKLKHLDLFHSSAFSKCSNLDEICERLASKNLKLETLSVQLKPNEKNLPLYGNPRGSSHGSIEIFLQSISKTLKVLKIFRAPVGAPFERFLDYCNMTALTELYLSGTTASTFNFLSKTPNLKKLCVDLECFEHRDRIAQIIREKGAKVGKYQKYDFDMAYFAKPHVMEGVFLEKLEYLKIDFEFKDVSSIELLAKWMPNLTTLKTILNDRTFIAACQLWGKNLSELKCMFGSRLHNPTICENVRHLKALQKFGLDAYCNEAKLSDKSVYEGFLQMPGLLSLNIYVNGKMSDKAEEALRNAVKFCNIIRPCKSSGGNSAKRYECCERTQFLKENGMERI